MYKLKKCDKVAALFLLLLLHVAVQGWSQSWPVQQMVINKHAAGVTFTELPALRLIAERQLDQRGIYAELRLDAAFISDLQRLQPEALKISIPLGNRQTLACELVKFDLGSTTFIQNNELLNAIPNIKIPLSYRGVVVGETGRNNVVLSVNQNYISLIVAMATRSLQISKTGDGPAFQYRLYNSEKVQFPALKLDCGTQNNPAAATADGIALTGINQRTDSASDKCVSVFVDCFDSLYIWRNRNTQSTIDYVYELFTAVATGYANEQINLKINTINIWIVADPYRGDTRENALADLAANYQDNFWGNIGVGLDYSINTPLGRSGLAGEIGKAKAVSPDACKVYAVGSHQFCYTDLKYNVSVQNFPLGPNTTGQQVYLVMHEIGHLLGAHHTKWCGWKLSSNPDVYGTLDSCAAIEGSCAQGPPPPASGATIMSYCVSGNGPNQFVSFNNGFGLLPGNAVRNFVFQTQCIPNCLACLTGMRAPQSGSSTDLVRQSHQDATVAGSKGRLLPLLPLPGRTPPLRSSTAGSLISPFTRATSARQALSSSATMEDAAQSK